MGEYALVPKGIFVLCKDHIPFCYVHMCKHINTIATSNVWPASVDNNIMSSVLIALMNVRTLFTSHVTVYMIIMGLSLHILLDEIYILIDSAISPVK